MGDPIKRNAILDWLFGKEPPAGDGLQAQKAFQLPRWMFLTQQSLLVIAVGLMALGLFDADRRIPLLGSWLEREWWGLSLIVAACMAAAHSVGWIYERRRRESGRDL